jgi:tRNA(fMet)-specific endonuclease VapC
VLKRQRLTTTIVTAAELFRGAFAHSRPEEKLRDVEELLEILIVLEMNLPAAMNYRYLHNELRRRGITVADRDLMIASIGMAYGETVVLTRDVVDFEKIPGIDVETY